MPKLFQINVCNNLYSSGKIVSAIGELAITNGWESFIAYSRDFAPSLNSPIRIGGLFDVCLNAFEQRIFDNTGFGLGSYFPTKRLIKKIDAIKPDIIHLHVLSGYYLHYNVLFHYLSKLDIPIVWTLHSCWDITGHCTHFDYENCEKWKTECFDCPLRKEYPQSYVFDRSRKNYKQKKELFTSLKDLHLVAVSKWLGSVVAQSYFKEKSLKVIYNGVDLKTFYPSEKNVSLQNKYGLTGKFVAVGLASTWLPKKGLNDYFELAKILPEDYRIMLIGLSKKQIQQLPLNIIGIEKTTDVNELRDIYSLANVVLNLSYEESFGLTTVEGLACGTPSIVYNKTASPELVSEETGFVVKAGDVNSVLINMQTIKNNGQSYYLRECRKRAEDLFDKDKNFQSYIDLYNKLLKF